MTNHIKYSNIVYVKYFHSRISYEIMFWGKNCFFYDSMIPEQHSSHQMPNWMQDFFVIKLLC